MPSDVTRDVTPQEVISAQAGLRAKGLSAHGGH